MPSSDATLQATQIVTDRARPTGWRLWWPFRFFGRREWFAFLALFLAYLIASQVGLHAYSAPAVISPAIGIAFAMFMLEGLALWPAVVLASLASYAVLHAPLSVTVFLTIANTTGPLVGAYLLRQTSFTCYFRRLRDLFLFFVAAIAGLALTPTIGLIGLTLTARLFTHSGTPEISWGSWWVGVITSTIIVAPVVMRWGIQPSFTRTRQEIIELILTFAFFFAVAIPLFWSSFNSIFGISLLYVALIPLFWLALRSGTRFLSLMLLSLAILAITGTFWGTTAAASTVALGTRLFQIEILLDILASIFYIIVTVEEERKDALRAVSEQIYRLEAVLGELEGESRAKTDFLAMLAHELRNPLAPVVSSIELLRMRSGVNEENLPVLEVMEGSVKTIKRLLDDLLDISRITQQKITLQREPFHVGAVARRAIQNMEHRLSEQRQTILLDLPKVPLMIEADPVRIEQVITNLLGNASKFTPRGGTISIIVKQHSGMAEIRVHDSGIGIDPSMLSKIFEPFVQIERGHQGQEGLGIGLALTQKLVEIHGGTVEAKSQGRGKGSEFIVRLPLAYTTREVSTRMPFPEFSAKREGMRRILVVDDNIPAARAIGALLSHDGHAVEYAVTGAEAKEKVRAFHPQVVIADIGLPDMNGYDLAKGLRRSERFEGLLVALTGYGLEQDRTRAFESGFDVHLTKPIAMRDLRQTLSAVGGT